MNPTAALLAALLSLFRPPADVATRLARRAPEIAAAAEAAETARGVPAGLLLFVGFAETHLGADAGEGGGWGSPADRFHRHTAGGPDAAARDLRASFRVCGSWLRAVARYRTGLCAPRHVTGYSPAFAIRTTERVYRAAGIPVPDHLR